jgi:1-aminocyclopropane-1-carboxylate deaminase/D-cysteine desulfhydrase-like pyridoxal-dependent ACC family enzyme
VIPEGGFDEWGVLGAASLAVGASIADPSIAGADAFAACADAFAGVDQVHLACGTGCMLAGMRLGLPAGIRLTGWNAHQGDWLAADVANAIGQRTEVSSDEGMAGWEIDGSMPAKGFGPVAMASIQHDWPEIPCDPVYMPRLLAGVEQRLRQAGTAGGGRWLIIHGGGLQGARTACVETG